MIYTPYSDINVRLIRTNHAWLSSSMYTAQHIDSTARSHVRLFRSYDFYARSCNVVTYFVNNIMISLLLFTNLVIASGESG